MANANHNKYQPFIPLPDLHSLDRKWPSKTIERAPIWTSVDLRDGNQALIEPMNLAKKLRLFEILVGIGFKQIEVGFPAASQPDYEFTRYLIEHDLIPDDVIIQVLVQCRSDLIEKTFESLSGAKSAIVHFYNSTSPEQRELVFGKDKAGIIDLALEGAALCKKFGDEVHDTKIFYEYSPESFSRTELDYALEVSEAVMDVLAPSATNKLIINLPATVETYTPNVFADAVEWFHTNVKNRDCLVLSLHPHNDRGTAVAAAELGLLAGADRIEGTLFGNGERTGNVDIVTLALNLFTQGIDPLLDFSDIDRIAAEAVHCTGLPIHPRQPYAGDLVYTAFSGSHQDAIKKGMAKTAANEMTVWQVPYLPIDPADVGRTYEAIIRVNSQSGKGGVAYIMKADHGLDLPRGLQREFSSLIQTVVEETETEISSAHMWERFVSEYLAEDAALALVKHELETFDDGSVRLVAHMRVHGDERVITGEGNGPISALISALSSGLGIDVTVAEYSEHAVGVGTDVPAVAYVEVLSSQGDRVWGVGIHPSVLRASLNAVVSAASRAFFPPDRELQS